MITRPMILAMNGWYPADNNACSEQIKQMIDKSVYAEDIVPKAAIVPHAGWYFSGDIAVNTIKSLKEKNIDTRHIFVFGGHMSSVNVPVIETFDKAETPVGFINNDKKIVDTLIEANLVQPMEFRQDNTIEILLPIIKYFFPLVSITAIYMPPNMKKIVSIMDKINEIASKNSLFIGSTDLTHYGNNYNFFHNDTRYTPEQWVANINDKQFISYLVNMEFEKALEHAKNNVSSCSSGAAVGTAYIANKRGVTKGKLLSYHTSLKVHKADSFVGYCGMLF